jgi:hypothetical protein
VRIGDVGPGGGIVLYDWGSTQEWGRYLEAAPHGWSWAARDPLALWTTDPDTGEPPLEEEIGLGWGNTDDMRTDDGGESAAWVASSYHGGGWDDWF